MCRLRRGLCPQIQPGKILPGLRRAHEETQSRRTKAETKAEMSRFRACLLYTSFTKAVSNMAIMDITDIEPLLMAVYELLEESGIFVFAKMCIRDRDYFIRDFVFGSDRVSCAVFLDAFQFL